MSNNKRKPLNNKALYSAATVALTLSATTNLVYADFVDDAKGGISGVDSGGSTNTVSGLLQSITSVLLFLVGAISVIMLIIGGIRFITSSGDAQATTSARNTIVYSVIGVIVAVSAYAIVSFTIGVVDKDAANDPGVAPDATAPASSIDFDSTPTSGGAEPGIDVDPSARPEGEASGVDVSPSEGGAEPGVDVEPGQ